MGLLPKSFFMATRDGHLLEAHRRLFRFVLITTTVLIFFYSLAFAYFGARFNSLAMLVGCFGWSPLAYWLDSKGKFVSSRLITIAIGPMCIFVSGLGMPKEAFGEVFFLPAMMLSLLLFDSTNKFEVSIGMGFPLMMWGISKMALLPALPVAWTPSEFPTDMFKVLNFFGAFTLTGIFLMAYRSYMVALKNRALQELEHSKLVEAQLERAQTLAKIGSWEFDLSTLEVTWSKETYQMFGIDPAEKNVFQSYRKLLTAVDLKALDQAMGKCAEEGTSYEIEHDVLLPSGEQKHLVAQGQVIRNPQGQATGIFGTIQDLTAQFTLKQLLVNQQMKLMANAKMVSLGEMAGGISHEINNPLAIILGKMGLLQRQLQKDPPQLDPVKLKESVETVIRTTHRIAKIIEGLRNFAKSSEGDPFKTVALNDVLQGAMDLCRKRFENHSVVLTVECPADLQIECRSTQISQALLNLLTNSFDAVQPLQDRWIHVHVTDGGANVLLRITDSGLGIPPSIAEKMLHPFFTTKPVGQGTGLGLSIANGLFQEHQGSLQYDSKHPHTSFVIEIPKSQIQQMHPNAKQSA